MWLKNQQHHTRDCCEYIYIYISLTPDIPAFYREGRADFPILPSPGTQCESLKITDSYSSESRDCSDFSPLMHHTRMAIHVFGALYTYNAMLFDSVRALFRSRRCSHSSFSPLSDVIYTSLSLFPNKRVYLYTRDDPREKVSLGQKHIRAKVGEGRWTSDRLAGYILYIYTHTHTIHRNGTD